MVSFVRRVYSAFFFWGGESNSSLPTIEYVQVKPILAAATLILKFTGKYNEGDFRANSGYLYISIIYNTSICLSLYCLAMFWVCVNDDLKPYR